MAPSPTGDNFHIGNVSTALVDYVFARQKNGKFVLRIEDTDRTRFVEGAEEKILESLKWLGIEPDESPAIGGPFGPYRQSERLELYQKYALELVDKGKAYYCFCTPERLDVMRKKQEREGQIPHYDRCCLDMEPQTIQARLDQNESHVIRLKVPDSGQTVFTDLIRGEISFENSLIDDQIILKADGFPTYHLAVVVDDHLMEISHIIRADEWIPSTPKHVLLYDALGWEMPIIAHMPLLRNRDRSKLSKRKNPVWVSWYREQGFLPQAIINYIGTLLWTRAEGEEIFTIDEMIKGFDLEKVNPTGPIWDQEKLTFINGVYIRKMSVGMLTDLLISEGFVPLEYQADRRYLEKTVLLGQERLKVLSEFFAQSKYFFETPAVDLSKAQKYIQDSKTLTALLNNVSLCLSSDDLVWEPPLLEKALRLIQEDLDIKPKDAFMTLRVIITGQETTPPLFDILELLGKNTVLERIQRIATQI